ncbi:MAG: NTP transferase domain-containing protein [Saprospiraceae bacterium]|nr:NTP transferase domain-containing protein [Saprospiraceae bacterium]
MPERITDRISASAAILAGGRSSRMHAPKPFLPLGGQTLCESLVDAFSEAGIQRIAVVLNAAMMMEENRAALQRIERGAEVIANHHPGRGRAHSIRLALNSLGKAFPVFLHNVDNPVLVPNALRDMCDALEPGAFVVPVCDGVSGHPVLISPEIIDALMGFPGNDWILREALRAFRRIELNLANRAIHWNLNTPEDYEAFRHQTIVEEDVLSGNRPHSGVRR